MTDRDKSEHLSEANKTLINEWLDLVANDSENVGRTMKCMTDDCIWVMAPGGTEYRGFV
jgi:ketosteroid isomerase-like protein